MDRVKPFFGSPADAFEIGKRDNDQFVILSINYFRGNPRVRTSLFFNITFENETCNRGYNADLANTSQFQSFIQRDPTLFPLHFTATQAKVKISQLAKTPITHFKVGDVCHLSLRYFDGADHEWFDSLNLPNKASLYVLSVTITHWHNTRHNRIRVRSALFDLVLILDGYDVFAFLTSTTITTDRPTIVVTSQLLDLYPAISTLKD
jgi:hypothetical protein